MYVPNTAWVIFILKKSSVYLKFNFTGLPYFYLLDLAAHLERNGRAIAGCRTGRP